MKILVTFRKDGEYRKGRDLFYGIKESRCKGISKGSLDRKGENGSYFRYKVLLRIFKGAVRGITKILTYAKDAKKGPQRARFSFSKLMNTWRSKYLEMENT